MRIAFVQGGPGLEAVETQVERLRRLSPERYQIEQHPTAPARQRMVELFDGLKVGDELCLSTLDPLRLDLGETAQVLLNLVDRGAHLVMPDDEGGKLDIGKSPETRGLLAALAGLHRRRKDQPAPPVPNPGPDMLTPAEVADIHRMNEAGLSPRRIGLIYRRSPKCISAILMGASEEPVEPHARRHA